MSHVHMLKLCPTLCNPMDCSSPGSSAHGIFQAGIVEWVAISYSWGSSSTRERRRKQDAVDNHIDKEDPLEKEMATHSNIPAWKIPWAEEPGGLQFIGLQRIRHDRG